MNTSALKAAGFALIITGAVFGGEAAQSSVHPSGEGFLYFCNATTGDDDGDARFIRCETFVKETRVALLDTPVHGIRACIPKEISNLKLVFTAIRWLEDNAIGHSKEADEVLALAFAEVWPCPEGS